MASTTKSRLRICCISATITILVAIAVLVTLGFIVFKPRDPSVVVLYPVGLSKVQLDEFITKDNVTSDLIISIRNHRNHASFKFENATSHIEYDVGELVGMDSNPRRHSSSAING